MYIPLKRLKKIAKRQLEIGSKFEFYFQLSSKTGPCLFLDRAKYRAKYSYLWHLGTPLNAFFLEGDDDCGRLTVTVVGKSKISITLTR